APPVPNDPPLPPVPLSAPPVEGVVSPSPSPSPGKASPSPFSPVFSAPSAKHPAARKGRSTIDFRNEHERELGWDIGELSNEGKCRFDWNAAVRFPIEPIPGNPHFDDVPGEKPASTTQGSHEQLCTAPVDVTGD